MEALEDYIKPELLITAIALYFMGIALKEAQAVKDKYIPLILGCAGILICGIYVFATCSCKNAQDIAMAVYIHDTGSPGGGAFYICEPADQTAGKR